MEALRHREEDPELHEARDEPLISHADQCTTVDNQKSMIIRACL
ncbi:hypothetical protein ES5_06462 [Dietzia cinnamea P4]|nr:hypothetical protein ES5_06462 [Dietzia cinnamea P4]